MISVNTRQLVKILGFFLALYLPITIGWPSEGLGITIKLAREMLHFLPSLMLDSGDQAEYVYSKRPNVKVEVCPADRARLDFGVDLLANQKDALNSRSDQLSSSIHVRPVEIFPREARVRILRFAPQTSDVAVRSCAPRRNPTVEDSDERKQNAGSAL